MRAAAVAARAPGTAPEPGAWESFRADLGRYFRYARAETLWERLRIAVHTEAVAALAVYRLGRWLRDEAPAPARLALKLPHSLAHEAVRVALGICLSPDARIGPGLYIGHSGGIWVAPGAVIGRDCNLSQGVTLGIGGTVRRGAPVLGDRVWIGPKATVSGPVKVGAGAVVGANSLVVTNVPEKGVAVGVPARVVALSGSGALIG
ncbi:serine O-acetyltransferase [Anaeromyxobacter oryzae]|uniref:Serine acetyltransferase n=1 Tax=Anaeromyxobacter oryzae TaxID=2918170 RepID=A0ABM7WNM6_9BACT|nr:hypothetical protein [Anaeromyxobacter oryzae]BDG01074.1 serine acetyltransferase [Anaeromyxobacter oryzae]